MSVTLSSSATLDARIAMVATRQHSAFSRHQAGEIGFSDSAIHHRIRVGRWNNPLPGVYTLAGCQRTWMQDVWVGYLAAGTDAVITHETAVHIHGVHSVESRPITLTKQHGQHARLHGAFVHQLDDLQRSMVINVAGLPVTTAARTIVDLAATQPDASLAKALDTLVKDEHTTYAKVGACLQTVARPHKPGVRKLARVLEERGDGYVPAQSELEEALFATFAAGGLPQPLRQYPLPGRGKVRGLVDGIFLAERVIVEADGRRWHARIDALKRDHERDTEAARAGFLTLRFVWEQVMDAPQEVCAAVADVLRTRANLN